jgi:hypothetical protein
VERLILVAEHERSDSISGFKGKERIEQMVDVVVSVAIFTGVKTTF